jgi:hypothetical protein
MPPIQTTSPQTSSQVVDSLSFPCQENLKTHNKITIGSLGSEVGRSHQSMVGEKNMADGEV